MFRGVSDMMPVIIAPWQRNARRRNDRKPCIESEWSQVRPHHPRGGSPLARLLGHGLQGYFFVDSLVGVHTLVVDGSPECRQLLSSILRYGGALVTTTASAAEALKVMTIVKCDVLVAEIVLPGSSGLALMRHVRGLKPEEGGVVRAIALATTLRIARTPSPPASTPISPSPSTRGPCAGWSRRSSSENGPDHERVYGGQRTNRLSIVGRTSSDRRPERNSCPARGRRCRHARCCSRPCCQVLRGPGDRGRLGARRDDDLERVKPDLLLSDLSMPERDGYWLIRRLRACPAEAGGTCRRSPSPRWASRTAWIEASRPASRRT